MRILSLFVRHGLTTYAGARQDLQAFYRSRMPDASVDLVTIDNDPETAKAGATDPGPVVSGSNRRWEFSAWDEGVAYVGPRLREYDYVHLVTSAFRTLYTKYIERFDTNVLSGVAGRAVALGHLDYYNDPIELVGCHSQSWIRTSFVFLPPRELEMLGSLVSFGDPGVFFHDDPRSPFRPDAPLSANYRRYITDWLTGAGTGQGVEWHSRFELTGENLARFQTKTMAILNEHMLAIRLRRQGTAVIDATWIASRASTGLPKVIPHWRVQLSERDTDAVPLPAA